MKRVLLYSGLVMLAAGIPSRAAQSTSNLTPQEHLSHEVRNELITLPQLSIFDHLAFQLNDGTVTLMGKVRNPVLKDSAEKAVKDVEGIKQVNNKIEILPPSSNDDRIRKDVARAIFNDDRLFRYSMGAVPPIHIIVSGGHVSLEGLVDNQSDKDAAGLRANGVHGVFSVQNNLRIGNSAASDN